MVELLTILTNEDADDDGSDTTPNVIEKGQNTHRSASGVGMIDIDEDESNICSSYACDSARNENCGQDERHPRCLIR